MTQTPGDTPRPRPPLWAAIVGLSVVAVALVLWTGFEARRQREQTEEALRRQADAVARSLGPALASTAAAVRELDEIVSWKLLDNARLLSWMDARGVLDQRVMRDVLDDNGLDLVAVVGPDGSLLRVVGEPWPAELVDVELAPILSGRADESVFERSLEDEPIHVVAAVRRSDGGALVARTHAGTAYAFAQRLGVSNLLVHLVDEGGVLYAAYDEEPTGIHAAATWDSRALPEPNVPGTVADVRGRAAFEVVVPVASPAGSSASLRLGLDATPLRRVSLAAMWRTGMMGLVLVAFGFLGSGFALIERRRLAERERAAARLADETDRRRRSERLAAAGSLAAGVAHEVRNPLNAISVAAQRLERCDAIGDCCRHLSGVIREEVLRLDDIVRSFLDLARPTFGERERLDAAEIVREVVEVLTPEAAASDISLEILGEGAQLAIVDREAVRRAVVNLVRNAIQASPRGSKIELQVEGDDAGIRIHVLDRGGGLAPGLADRAFDPFVTGRAAGTGLGLALVRRVAEDHGGWARLATRPGGGAEAVLELNRGDRP
jgi:signal transduction histidine kinase